MSIPRSLSSQIPGNGIYHELTAIVGQKNLQGAMMLALASGSEDFSEASPALAAKSMEGIFNSSDGVRSRKWQGCITDILNGGWL
jgi:hypothetical protein